MKSKVQLAVVILLIGGGYGYYEYDEFTTINIPAMEAERQAGEEELAKKQSELVRLKEFASNIETIKQELRELNLQLESALEHMPRSFNLSGLLRKLTMLAQNSGVDLSSFRPSKGDARQDAGFYSAVTIDFDLQGTFTQNLVFFDQLSRLKRIVNIESLKMTGGRADASSNAANVVSTQGSIRTYRFTE